MDVKTLCLGVLSQGDRTGYEIKKHFECSFRHFFVAGYGSIYPALADLAKRGLVRAKDVEQTGKPDKKVYTITPEGMTFLRAELQATEPKHRIKSEFLVLMYFGNLLEPERLIEVLDSMIEQWEGVLWQELEEVERAQSQSDAQPLTPGEKFALGYGRTVLGAALAYSRRHRDQLVRELEQTPSAVLQAAE